MYSIKLSLLFIHKYYFTIFPTQSILWEITIIETKCSVKGNKVFAIMKQLVLLRETLCSL